jgi:hypothetical protein
VLAVTNAMQIVAVGVGARVADASRMREALRIFRFHQTRGRFMSLSSRLRLTLLLGTLLTVGATPAVAQTELGIIGGATFSTLRGIDVDDRTGTLIGAYLLRPFVGPLQWQIEGVASSRGATPRNGGTGNALELRYFEVPVMLRLSLARGSQLNPHVYAGPYAGVRINCSVEGTSGDCDDLPGISTNSVDLGGIAGGGVSVDVGGLMLTGGVRYTFGVSNIAEFERENVREAAKHGGYAIYAGLGLRFGR